MASRYVSAKGSRMGMSVRGTLTWIALLGAGIVSGCGDDNFDAALTITKPIEDQQISSAEDENADREGIQYTILVSSEGLSTVDEVELFLDGVVFADPENPASGGQVTFSQVSLPGGEHTLQARARNGAIQSDEVTIQVDDPCSEITFLNPIPPSGGDLHLGATDDTDGQACGITFTTTVALSTSTGDGQTVRLFVNDTERGSTTVSGTSATFTSVGLDNRGADANSIAVEVDNADGSSCRRAFPTDVFVDCEGPSCAIANPTGAILNKSNDQDNGTEGLQVDITVATNESGAQQPIRLVIDNDESGAESKTPTTAAESAIAIFNAAFTDGNHTVQAECEDGDGVKTRSAAIQWRVDTVACSAAITSPTEDQVFPPSTSLPITVTADVSGDGCAEARAAACSGLEGTDYAALADNEFEGEVDLSTSRNQTICVQVRDDAGNESEAVEVNISYVSTAPELAIETPDASPAYNILGDGTHIGDLDTDSTTCEAEFVVYCTEVDAEVTLHLEGDTDVLAGGAANCDAATGLPTPFVGQATFASVSLPTADSSYNVVAQQTALGVVGSSDPFSLEADCEAPILDFTVPDCSIEPVLLNATTDDEDGGEAGLQYTIGSIFTQSPTEEATLNVVSGVTLAYTEDDTTVSSANIFEGADFTSGGAYELTVTATDPANNTGTSPTCELEIVDLPVVDLTAPPFGAVFNQASLATDCDTGDSGLQVTVTGTTDAGDGSEATVEIGAVTTGPVTITGGVINICADAPEGDDLVVTLTVTDVVPERGVGSDTTQIDVDTETPVAGITDLGISQTIDRRGWEFEFSWTAIADTDGDAFSVYYLRCVDSESAQPTIDDETDWDNATTQFTLSSTPAVSGGQTEVVDLPDFHMGSTQNCVLRAADDAGNLTAIPTNFGASAPWLSVTVDNNTGTGVQLGDTGTAIGDVSGDGVGDILVAGEGEAIAYLILGSDTALPTTPTVTFTDSTDSDIVAITTAQLSVASLGDINGDTIADFAIGNPYAESAAFSSQGAVYIFYGRSSETWSATPTVDVSPNWNTCGADACLRGEELFAALGISVAGIGDFDNGGVDDIAVGAYGSSIDGFEGRVYVIRGESVLSGNISIDPTSPATGPDGFMVEDPAGTDLQLFGNSLAWAGDFDADSHTDFVVGATGFGVDARLFTVRGEDYAGSGLIAATQVTETFVAQPEVAGVFGAVITNVGDYNGDGYYEIAVAEGDANDANEEDVSLFWGSASGYSGASMITIDNDTGNTPSELFGNSQGVGHHPFLGHTGDLDGDGLSDILLGANGMTIDFFGTVQIFYGQTPAPSGINRSSSLAADSKLFRPGEVDGTSDNDPNRKSAMYVGDVNGDGYLDFAVGDPSAGPSDAGQLFIYY